MFPSQRNTSNNIVESETAGGKPIPADSAVRVVEPRNAQDLMHRDDERHMTPASSDILLIFQTTRFRPQKLWL